MTLDAFLHFFIQHNETIILLTIAIICLLSVYVVFRQVFRTSSSSLDAVDFSKIEDTLKKLLSQTHSAIDSVSGATADGSGRVTGSGTGVTGATGSLGNANADGPALKKELEARAAMIEELKKQVVDAKANEGASAELLAKIKDLEGKLAEYEIIEDDIADLSHYKEENARLKKQLEQISRGGPALVDQFADAVKSDASTANAAPVPNPAKPSEPAPTAAPPAEPTKPQTVEEAVQAAQAKVVPPPVDDKTKVGDTLEFSADKKPDASPKPESDAPNAENAPAKPAQKEAKGDIFAEFSGAEAEGSDPLAALGEIDTNRMLEELKDLNGDLQGSPETANDPADKDKGSDEAAKLAGDKKVAGAPATKSEVS